MTIVDTLVYVLSSSQTEIMVFFIAVFLHSLVFGKYSLGKTMVSTKKKATSSGMDGSGQSLSPQTSPRQLVVPSGLVRAMQALIQQQAGQEAFARALSRFMGQIAPDGRPVVLAGMLSTLGKAVCRDLIAACREYAREQGMQGSAQVSEAFLRGYLVLRMEADFNELLAEVEAEQGLSPAIATLAMRAAVHSADISAAFGRLSDISAAWRAGSASTPSTAYSNIFHQFIRLSLEKDDFTRLLEELQKHDLFVGWTVQALLGECAQLDCLDKFNRVRELAVSRGVEFTCGAFAAMIRMATSASGALRSAEEAHAGGKFNKEVTTTVAAAAAKYGHAGLAELAAKSLPANPAAETAAAVLRLYARGGPLAGGDADAAVLRFYTQRLAGTTAGLAVRGERLVADAALRAGKPEVLRQLLAPMADTARQVAFLKSYAGERRLQDCITIFRAFPEKSTCLYNAVLDACVDCGDLKLAEELMAEASRENLADVVTHNTMIKASVRQGDARRARGLIAAMRRSGLEPNCVTFNELLDAAVRDRPETMWSIIAEMRASGCKPNHVTCSIVLKSVSRASRANEVERALAVVEEMEEAMDEVLLSSVCEACIRSGRTDLLSRQLERQHGPESVQIKGAHTFGSIIRAYGVLHDMNSIWNAWREMKKRHILPTSVTLGCMVEALASNGHVGAGYELIREQMADPQVRPLVNAVIYCSVLKGFSHRKRFDRVWAVYDEMRAEKLQFSIVTYNTLVDACARSGDMGRIPGLLEEMASQNIEPNVITYSAIVKGYCQENRLDRAFELLEDMKKTKSFNPDEVTYNTLIDGCARYGVWEKGMSVLEEMEAAGVPPSQFTLSVLVKLAIRSKRPEKGFELVDTIGAKYNIRLSVHVFNNLIQACTQNCWDFEKALGVLERMIRERVKPDSRTYVLLLRGGVSAKAAQDTAGLLRAAAGLKDPHHRLQAFSKAALQPSGGLPSDAITEALEGISGACGNEGLAVSLLCELRHAPGIKIDPRLPMRLTTKVAKSQR